MKRKETATAIATALADVETAVAADDFDAASDALVVLHKALRTGLYQHGAALGLTAADIAEIDNLGPQRRGGEPKEPIEPGGEG